jgi:hypothetical protein
MYSFLSAMEALSIFLWINGPSAIILTVFLSAVVLMLLNAGRNNTQHDTASKILVNIRHGRKVLPMRVSSERTVRGLKKLAARKFKLSCCTNSVILRMGSKILDDNGILRYAHNCELQLHIRVKGGTGHFSSIPVQNLRPLMIAIKSDFDQWVVGMKPEVKWDGSSSALQYYFKKEGIKPYEKYKRFYSRERRTLSVSYVWRATKILTMAGRDPLCFTNFSIPCHFNESCLFFWCR